MGPQLLHFVNYYSTVYLYAPKWVIVIGDQNHRHKEGWRCEEGEVGEPFCVIDASWL